MNTKVASAEVIDQSKRGYGYVPILLVELTASVQDVRDSGTAGLPFPTTSCTIPLRARSSKNPSMAYFLLLLNHIGVCKVNSLIQHSEIVLELSSNNKIYRNLTGSLIWRPERNGKEFDPLFAFCNCSSSVAVIVSPLVSFECPMTVKSSCGIYLIVNRGLFKCDRTKRGRFSIYRSYHYQ